jgi:hypothetical protein
VMRVDDRARLTYAAATPAVRKVSGARQHPATIPDNAKALGYLFARSAGSRDAHRYSDINMFVDDAPLKNSRGCQP